MRLEEVFEIPWWLESFPFYLDKEKQDNLSP